MTSQFVRKPNQTQKLWHEAETQPNIPTPKYSSTVRSFSIRKDEKLDKGSQWVMGMNAMISSFNAIVVFKYMENWWEVKRIAIHNDRMYLVIYIDYENMERRAFVLRKVTEFKILEDA